MEDSFTKTGFPALIAIIAYLSGKFSNLFWILCILMIIDYATGFISSVITHKTSSKIGLMGILKKCMYVMIIVFGFIIDLVILNAAHQLNIGFIEEEMRYISVGTILILFYISNESLSIIENCERMNLKIPSFFKKIIFLIRNLPNAVLEPFFKKNAKYLKNEKESDDNKDDTETKSLEQADANDEENNNQQ